MASPEDEETDAFMAVQKMDAEFKMQAAQQKLDPLVEANALQELMKGWETIFHILPSTKTAAASVTTRETLLCHAHWISHELGACIRAIFPTKKCMRASARRSIRWLLKFHPAITDGCSTPQGKEMSTVESACCSLLSKEQWEHALQAHSRWNEAGLEATGREVARVVDELDAPHLKPTGIMERIKAGNAPACHGLVRLLSLMKPQ
jgi:hypothetical protein